MELEVQAEQFVEEAKKYNRTGQTEKATAAYLKAVALFEQAGSERGQARCWSGLGKSYGRQRDLERSADAFQRAAQHSVAVGWDDKAIETLYNFGLTIQQIGVKSARLDHVFTAIEAFQQALDIAERIHDLPSAGVLYINLGLACAWCKRDDEAIHFLDAAAASTLDDKDFDTSFSVLSSLGALLSNHNRAEEAIVHFERALELAKSADGDIVAVADTYANLGIAYEKAGRLEAAIEALETYHEILHVAGDIKASDAMAMVKRLKNKVRMGGGR
jgi:tetratricopeptide (TPR) repeat protein